MVLTTPTQPGNGLGRTYALDVRNLGVAYNVRGKDRQTLKDVSFSIGQQESFGLVGESGCGKSTTVQAITQYLSRNGRATSGSIAMNNRDVLAMSPAELRRFRTRDIAVVYQEPMRALNPSIRIGRQVAEVFEVAGAGRKEALERAEHALQRVQIADPGRVMKAYPHQLSGGMLQRVVIAMAIAVEPTLLILDEPTTALDATVEAEVLDLVSGLREQVKTAILFISHNLAVIEKMCDRVGVMYAGEIVEEGPARQVFDNPRHPYTVGLLRCVPRQGQRKELARLDTIPGFLPAPGQVTKGCLFASRCALVVDVCRTVEPNLENIEGSRAVRCIRHEHAHTIPHDTSASTLSAPEPSESEPVIRLRNVSKTYVSRHESVRALVGVDLELYAGETLGVVGESGCGKSTLARVLLGLASPDEGSVIEINGREVAATAAGRTQDELRQLQIVFQNPDSALNRRHSVRHLIERPLRKLGGLTGQARKDQVDDIVTSVRMEARHLPMKPAQLSGGLKQRVAIARAFAARPTILVCDEPTSALDVSVQAAILNLLVDLQDREQVAYVFISHDLGVVRYLADRIAVLYLGRVMECGPAEEVFGGPQHPYTEALLSAAPSLDGVGRERIELKGEIPSPSNPPSGCVFNTRCPRRLTDGTCENVEPPLRAIGRGKEIRCHLPVSELRRAPTLSSGVGPGPTTTSEAV